MKRVFAGVAVCASIVGAGLKAQADTFGPVTQWTVAAGGNGHYYQAVAVVNPISWTDSENAANAVGGYLATITSAGENSFVFSIIDNQAFWFQSANNHGPWIGGFQPPGSVEPAGGFQWLVQPGASTAEPFSYTNWTVDEPSNDGGTEDSVAYFKLGTGRAATWNDAPNLNTFERSYVVEFNTPEPSSVGVIGGLVAVGTRRRRRRMR